MLTKTTLLVLLSTATLIGGFTCPKDAGHPMVFNMQGKLLAKLATTAPPPDVWCRYVVLLNTTGCPTRPWIFDRLLSPGGIVGWRNCTRPPTARGCERFNAYSLQCDCPANECIGVGYEILQSSSFTWLTHAVLNSVIEAAEETPKATMLWDTLNVPCEEDTTHLTKGMWLGDKRVYAILYKTPTTFCQADLQSVCMTTFGYFQWGNTASAVSNGRLHTGIFVRRSCHRTALSIRKAFLVAYKPPRSDVQPCKQVDKATTTPRFECFCRHEHGQCADSVSYSEIEDRQGVEASHFELFARYTNGVMKQLLKHPEAIPFRQPSKCAQVTTLFRHGDTQLMFKTKTETCTGQACHTHYQAITEDDVATVVQLMRANQHAIDADKVQLQLLNGYIVKQDCGMNTDETAQDCYQTSPSDESPSIKCFCASSGVPPSRCRQTDTLVDASLGDTRLPRKATRKTMLGKLRTVTRATYVDKSLRAPPTTIANTKPHHYDDYDGGGELATVTTPFRANDHRSVAANDNPSFETDNSNVAFSCPSTYLLCAAVVLTCDFL